MNHQDQRVLFSSTTSETRDWETPKLLFQLLDQEFFIDMDVAAEQGNALSSNWLGPDHPMRECRDCLTVGWGGLTCYMNPPYGDSEIVCVVGCQKKICARRGHHNLVYRPGIMNFMDKALREARDGGAQVI